MARRTRRRSGAAAAPTDLPAAGGPARTRRTRIRTRGCATTTSPRCASTWPPSAPTTTCRRPGWRGLQDQLLREMTARVPEAEDSVRWRRGGREYFTRTVPGLEFEQFCRAGGPGAARRGAARREPAARRPGLPGRLRRAGRARGQPGRAAAGLLGRLRPATRCTSCGSATWAPARTCRSGSSGPTTGWPGPRTRRRCSTRSPTRRTGRSRSGGTSSAPGRAPTCWCTARTTSGSSSSSGPPAAAGTC